MRIGILTGGGDVPGLNACIKAVVTRAAAAGHEVLGLRRGWAALVDTNPDDPDSAGANTMPLTTETVRTVDRTGGTFLHTSRTNPGQARRKDLPAFHGQGGEDTIDLTSHAMRVLEHLGVDVLIPIGGDDTLSYGLRLHDEGVPVVAIPKTMDNDVFGTDYCIGFSTAVSRGLESIHHLRTSTASHERIGVIELFGRYSGETSLITAYLAGVDRAAISEVPVDVERLAGLLMSDRNANSSHYAMVTISEGAILEGGEMALQGEGDAFGHRKLGGIGAQLCAELERITSVGIELQVLAYLVRSGPPDALDRMVAMNYGTMAIDMVLEGTTGRMVALRSGAYTSVPISMTREGVKRVDVAGLYDTEQYRPRIRQVDGQPMFLT